MKVRWRYGIAFPLILAVALGGLSAWLGRISEVEIEEVRLNPDEPQYTMDGLDGRRFDEQGYLKEHLSAKGAKQFPENSDIHFDSPHLVFFQEGRLLYEVGSDEAVYHTENKQVLFKNNVVLTKTADGRRQAVKSKPKNCTSIPNLNMPKPIRLSVSNMVHRTVRRAV